MKVCIDYEVTLKDGSVGLVCEVTVDSCVIELDDLTIRTVLFSDVVSVRDPNAKEQSS